MGATLCIALCWRSWGHVLPNAAYTLADVARCLLSAHLDSSRATSHHDPPIRLWRWCHGMCIERAVARARRTCSPQALDFSLLPAEQDASRGRVLPTLLLSSLTCSCCFGLAGPPDAWICAFSARSWVMLPPPTSFESARLPPLFCPPFPAQGLHVGRQAIGRHACPCPATVALLGKDYREGERQDKRALALRFHCTARLLR